MEYDSDYRRRLGHHEEYRADRRDRSDRHERHSKASRKKHSKKKHSKRSKHSKKSKKKESRKEKSVDKNALLRIAQENLAKMIEKGDLPKTTDISKLKLKHLREMSTQQSITQWTELCRAISAMEAAAYSELSSDFDSDSDSDYDTRSRVSHHSTKDDTKHPFQLKERREIEINVRDFVKLQTRSAKEVQQELREQFPVSSGYNHKTNDDEWVEVKPPSPKRVKKNKDKVTSNDTDHVGSMEDIMSSEFMSSNNPHVDIGTVMAQKLNAMRKLQEDPCNVVALKQMFQAQETMHGWVNSKTAPGQYTGTTGVNVLSPDELEGPSPAWTKKDQLLNAEPIKEGIGMHLLLKMGWKPGEGLGKNGEGNRDPVIPVLKFDTKGLVAESEVVKNLPMQLVTQPSEAVGKHPVSMLQEYCSKKKWIVPLYEMIHETGPDHKKSFLMKVLVNGVEYQPSMSCPSKKQAKALAATVCLQAFGLLPKDEKETPIE